MVNDPEFLGTWEEWQKKESKNYVEDSMPNGRIKRKYLKKGYLHLDNRIWFPNYKNEICEILGNKLFIYNSKNQRMEWWSFMPLIKTLSKTPRYKYQKEEDGYKLETKTRPLCYASHKDSLVFGFYSYSLNKVYEKYINENGFGECPIAYRSDLDGYSNIQFAKDVFEEIKKRKHCSAIGIDIKGFFDNLEHIKLKINWEEIIGSKLSKDEEIIFNAVTKYSYISLKSIWRYYRINYKKLDTKPKSILDLLPGSRKREKFNSLRDSDLIVTNNSTNKKTGNPIGIPQGIGMSSVLSNIYMLDFDKLMSGLQKSKNIYYRRYSDDIIIICESEDVDTLLDQIKFELENNCNLEIQSKKLEIIDFKLDASGKFRAFDHEKLKKQKLITRQNQKYFYKNLQYLGFEFDGIKPTIRPSSLSRFYQKMIKKVNKTVGMAYSANSKNDKIQVKKLIEDYTHLGSRNFITYGYNAAEKLYTNASEKERFGLNSPAIKNQLRNHFDILMKSIDKKSEKRWFQKNKKGKLTEYKHRKKI